MPTALVTGASRGLGRALAEALAERATRLIIDGRDPATLVATADRLRTRTEVVAVAGDVSDSGHRAALADAVRQLGGLDLLVHNASTLGASPLPSLDAVDLAALERTYAVNVVAPVALTQAVAPDLHPSAVVVAISSDAAREPYAGWGAYGASKAALEHTFAIWAVERPDLRVLVVDPGDMRTRMHQDAAPGEDLSALPLPEERVPGLLALLEGPAPSGRYRLTDVLAGLP